MHTCLSKKVSHTGILVKWQITKMNLKILQLITPKQIFEPSYLESFAYLDHHTLFVLTSFTHSYKFLRKKRL